MDVGGFMWMDKAFFSLKFKLQWFLKANGSKLHYSGGCTKWWHKILLQKITNITETKKPPCRHEIWHIDQLENKMRLKQSHSSLTLVQYSFDVIGIYSSIICCQRKLKSKEWTLYYLVTLIALSWRIIL